MTEDFALIDFALSARSPVEIAEALGRARPAAPGNAPRQRGLIGRLLGGGARKDGAGQMRSRLRVQAPGTLPPPPLVRNVLTDFGAGAATGPIRLTAPLGVAGLTLIEFCEGDGETSPLCERLSAALRGDEVFYFRHSGSRHPGAHFAFHVYQDGRLTRRAESVCHEGGAPEDEWIGADSGIMHPLETDSMPPPGTPKRKIMTPVRQAAILEALGIDPDELFAPSEDPMHVVLELSESAGGRPLEEARAVVEEQRRPPGPAAKPEHAAPLPYEPHAPAAIRPGAAERPVPAFPHAEATPRPQQQPPAPPLQPAPQPAPPAREPAAIEVPRPRPDSPLVPPGHRQPWEEQKPAPSWEEEVTSILVAAVESALPGDDQVGWLDDLTQQLEHGDIDGALAEAHRMILAGDREDGAKHAAAARLSQLFGRDDEHFGAQ